MVCNQLRERPDRTFEAIIRASIGVEIGDIDRPDNQFLGQCLQCLSRNVIRSYRKIGAMTSLITALVLDCTVILDFRLL